MADTRNRRLRVFAGPNGSGKTSVIQFIRDYKVNNQNVDFGYYINADDINQALLTSNGYSLTSFDFEISINEFQSIVTQSGLINENFKQDEFENSFKIIDNEIHCTNAKESERLAQIIADYLRKKLLMEGKKFSFETVFSHPSKLDIMREAVAAGYKVYLYFVCTQSADINISRVQARTEQGGHAVSTDKIISRYTRALELLFEAAQISYQTYFFDNSGTGRDFKPFAHFKVVAGKKEWDAIIETEVPAWFVKYYSAKIQTPD